MYHFQNPALIWLLVTSSYFISVEIFFFYSTSRKYFSSLLISVYLSTMHCLYTFFWMLVINFYCIWQWDICQFFIGSLYTIIQFHLRHPTLLYMLCGSDCEIYWVKALYSEYSGSQLLLVLFSTSVLMIWLPIIINYWYCFQNLANNLATCRCYFQGVAQVLQYENWKKHDRGMTLTAISF